MILDSIENSSKYNSLHPSFRRAFEILREGLCDLPIGKHTIDGDDVFVIISENNLMPADEVKLECHNRYIDIQVVLTENNQESYGWACRKDCVKPIGEFDADKDIIFYADMPTSIISARQSQFVIFYPEDAHAPLIGCGAVKKAVIKVKVN